MDAKERSDVVESALLRVLTEDDDYEEGDVLIEWILVAYVTNPDEEKMSAYPILMSNGTMPTYRVRGLLSVALDSYRVTDD